MVTTEPEYLPSDHHILYVFILPSAGSGDSSFFQGFNVNTFFVTGAIQYVCNLPPTVSELFRTRDEAIRWRAAGVSGYSVLLLELEFLDQLRRGHLITCVISNPDTIGPVELHLLKYKRQGWLHLTMDETSTTVPHLSAFSRADMDLWIRGVVVQVLAEKSEIDSDKTDFRWRPFVQWPADQVQLESRFHNITSPTETALLSLGFVLSKGKKSLMGASDEQFARAISDAAAELECVRTNAIGDRHLIPGTPKLILTVPSVYRHLSASQFSRRSPRAVRRAVQHVLRQKQYVAMKESPEETKEILEDKTAAMLMLARADELRAYTAALAVSSASLCAPVLRCPPQIDHARELLIKLAGSVRSRVPNIERLNRLALKIGAALRSAIPPTLLERIEHHKDEGIKLIGDTPLELLPIDDLPLGLRATVSRLPTLPGNLLMRQSLMRAPTFIRSSDLKQILVVRAFGPRDPLRNLLVTAIQGFETLTQSHFDLRVVDVSTKDEFVAAFNNFDGNLAIFDGHGSHRRTDPQGTITIGSIRLNPFELYGKIRVPPIMFLSACETHTLEGIESSVASAFLFMGTRSVLGTLVPINALNAGILIARFLFRFSALLPHITVAMPWSQVVSGMLRMSYVTDVMRRMEAEYSFSEDVYKAIHTEANVAINEFRPGWFEQVLKAIAENVSQPFERVRDSWLRTCYFTETLRYVHLGQPEHLFVTPS